MKIEELPISSIKPYSKNARKNDRAVDGVAASIKEFGFQQPIVIDRDGIIVVGHTRYKAAKKLGLATVPCVRADELSKEQVKAYRIADNKLNELATWDFELLADELSSFEFDFSPMQIELPTIKLDALATSQTTSDSGSSSLSQKRESLYESSTPSSFSLGIYVEVETEEEQEELYNRLTEEGYKVRTTTI